MGESWAVEEGARLTAAVLPHQAGPVATLRKGSRSFVPVELFILDLQARIGKLNWPHNLLFFTLRNFDLHLGQLWLGLDNIVFLFLVISFIFPDFLGTYHF